MLSTNTAETLRDAFLRRFSILPHLHLIDVGVSGGIHHVWREWGNKLVALGLDVLESEIERLRAEERLPLVSYDTVRVSGPGADSARPQETKSNYALHRSAAYLGTTLLSQGLTSASQVGSGRFLELWRKVAGGSFGPHPIEANYSNVAEPLADPFFAHYQRLFEDSLGATKNIRYTAKSETLDQIVERLDFPTIDLLKIDTDGYELDVLRGATQTLDRGCLAVEVEVQFHGKTDDQANVFANIDAFLRRRGFTLMKLNTHCYGRSALPRPFVYPELPAQTEGGPIQWGDALYVRDLLAEADRGEQALRSADCRSVQIAAMILDIYDLGDAAAELILAFPQCFADEERAFLDVLARRVCGPNVGYEEAIRRFCDGVANYRRSGK
jgi:hypothetical protein